MPVARWAHNDGAAVAARSTHLPTRALSWTSITPELAKDAAQGIRRNAHGDSIAQVTVASQASPMMDELARRRGPPLRQNCSKSRSPAVETAAAAAASGMSWFESRSESRYVRERERA